MAKLPEIYDNNKNDANVSEVELRRNILADEEKTKAILDKVMIYCFHCSKETIS